MSDLTVIILTMNEGKNIYKCIDSVRSFAKRIVVIDSGSTDDTVEIDKKLNVDLYFHEFKDYSSQFNWGLDNTGIDTLWVLRLDADEVITPELKTEMILEMEKHKSDDINGMILKLKQSFLGRWLKYGGTYPFEKLMLFKYGIGRIEVRKMDEHTILKEGKTIILKNDALHYDFRNISYYIHKHNWYATREAQDYIENNMFNSASNLEKGQLRGRRRQKVFYYKLPKFVRAFAIFLFRYFFQLGFLDGKEGFIYHILENFWYRFLVDIKIYEYEKTGNLEETGALK